MSQSQHASCGEHETTPYLRRELRRGLRRVRNGFGPVSVEEVYCAMCLVLEELARYVGREGSHALRAELPPAWACLMPAPGEVSAGPCDLPMLIDRVAQRLNVNRDRALAWVQAVMAELARQLAHLPPQRVRELLPAAPILWVSPRRESRLVGVPRRGHEAWPAPVASATHGQRHPRD